MAGSGVISVVESCYRLDGDREAWLRRVIEATRPLIDQGLGAQGLVVRRTGYGKIEFLAEVFLGPPATHEFAHSTIEGSSAEEREIMFRWTPIVDLAQETMAKFDVDASGWSAHSPEGHSFADMVAMYSRDGSNEVVGISAYAEHVIQLSPRMRATMRKLAWHITAGWRLVRAPRTATEEAVLEPDGRCVHAVAEARDRDAREVLREAARAVDRARGALRRKDPEEALSLWRGLIRGRWSLVDRFESDGRRYLIAHRNDPGYEDPRRLTRREQQCASKTPASVSSTRRASWSPPARGRRRRLPPLPASLPRSEPWPRRCLTAPACATLVAPGAPPSGPWLTRFRTSTASSR